MPSSSVTSDSGAADSRISVEGLKLFNIFRELPDEKIGKIARIIEIEEAPEGEAIIADGGEGDTFYLLLEGEVEVTKVLVMRMSRQELDQTDKSLIRLSAEPHPDFGKPCFGEMALFTEKCKRSAAVTAVRPSTLGVIHHRAFISLCESDPEIGYRVFRNIAGLQSSRLDLSLIHI